MALYARTVLDSEGNILPKDQWQLLDDHLYAVASAAQTFASAFGADAWAWLAGLWHDAGKAHPDFQQMLLDVSQGRTKPMVDHSSAGAILADRLVGGLLRAHGHQRLPLLLVAPIAGHHAGLPEGVDELDDRLRNRREAFEAARGRMGARILSSVRRIPAPPPRLIRIVGDRATVDWDEWTLRLEFAVRMLLSALVDADRLDAARIAGAVRAGKTTADEPAPPFDSLACLRDALDGDIDGMVATRRPDEMSETQRCVFEYRQEVLRACRAASTCLPGAFTLAVATGGGKTLSSLSFALRHAVLHGRQRVIVVIPFTSIIEQTAAEYRRALGALSHNVIEHHSAVDEDTRNTSDSRAMDSESERRRLVSENWDAPIVVTTAVQFFESLLASRASKCRKLHNIANSVVILDEVQTLPPRLLDPTVWLLNELVEGYGVTAVLSTATQPSLESPFPEVRNTSPMVATAIPLPPPRVRTEFLEDEVLDWPTLAARLACHQAVLCITHKRRDAYELTSALDAVQGDCEAIHLSASMCAAHRSLVIAEIRRRLAEGVPCRVISTQLVEAGVDLDFPVVYRCLAGIDSLVQAAGRANREGRLGERGGLLRVFRAPTTPPPGLPQLASDSAEAILRAASLEGKAVDIFDPAVGRAYFRDYYSKIGNMDGDGIRRDREQFRYQSVSEKYRFIDSPTLSVVVPWSSSARELLEELDRSGPSMSWLRCLQPFTVSVFPGQLRALQEAASVLPVMPGDAGAGARLFRLQWLEPFYTRRFGLQVSPNPGPLSMDAWVI